MFRRPSENPMESRTSTRAAENPLQPSNKHPAIKPGSRLNGAPGSRAVEDLALALDSVVIDESDNSDAENWMEVYSPKKNRFTYTISFDMDLDDMPPPSTTRKSIFGHREHRKSGLRRKVSGASNRRDSKITMDVGKRYKHPRLPPPALTLPVPPLPYTATPSAAPMASTSASASTSDDSSSAEVSSFDCTENTKTYRSQNTSAFQLRSKASLAALNLNSAPVNAYRARASPRTPRRYRARPVRVPVTPLGVPEDVSHFPPSPISPAVRRTHRALQPKSPKPVRTHRVRPPGLGHVVSPNHTRTAFVHVQPRVRVAAGPRPLASAAAVASSVATPTPKVPVVVRERPPLATPKKNLSMPDVSVAARATTLVSAISTPRRPLLRGPRPTPPRRSVSAQVTLAQN